MDWKIIFIWFNRVNSQHLFLCTVLALDYILWHVICVVKGAAWKPVSHSWCGK